jgi:hypothetical protein
MVEPQMTSQYGACALCAGYIRLQRAQVHAHAHASLRPPPHTHTQTQTEYVILFASLRVSSHWYIIRTLPVLFAFKYNLTQK